MVLSPSIKIHFAIEVKVDYDGYVSQVYIMLE